MNIALWIIDFVARTDLCKDTITGFVITNYVLGSEYPNPFTPRRS